MNISNLYKEKSFINHQFPTVTGLNEPPTLYEGMLRCEKGEVKELAEKGVWPFTEYVNWHRFRMTLPDEYPLKPPVVTWLSEISHPNIVPNIPGAVCISVLGDNWRPDLKLVSVVNALYYLLSDPNPNNVFNYPKALEAAKVCRKYGFPKKGLEKKPNVADDIVRFNMIPLPRMPQPHKPPKPTDVVRFKIRHDAKSRPRDTLHQHEEANR